MAGVLVGIVSDLRAIVGGSSAVSLIPRGRYTPVEYVPESLLPAATCRPYPFEIEAAEVTEPVGYPQDVAGDYAYYGQGLTIRVGYAWQPHEAPDSQDTILTDRDEIRLAIEDPRCWSASGWVAATVTGGDIIVAPIPGAEGEVEDVLRVLEIRLEVVYRETRP